MTNLFIESFVAQQKYLSSKMNKRNKEYFNKACKSIRSLQDDFKDVNIFKTRLAREYKKYKSQMASSFLSRTKESYLFAYEVAEKIIDSLEKRFD